MSLAYPICSIAVMKVQIENEAQLHELSSRMLYVASYMGYRLTINCHDNGVKFYGRKGVNTLNLDKFES